MKLIRLQGATIALATIDNISPNRRECEKAAIQSLMDYAAGCHTEILHNADGSPYPAPPCTLHISVSHSRHMAALLWSDSPGWGLDIEEARHEQLSRIAARVINQDELEAFSENLVQAWTLKEAAFKAAGLPIANLREIHIASYPLLRARESQLRSILSEAVEADGRHAWLSVVQCLTL